MMRILYLHQYFTTPQAKGGTRSYEFARRMVAAGHSVRVITSSANFSPASLDPRGGRTLLSVAGIELVVLHVPYANSLRFEQRIAAFARFAALAAREALAHDADLVFATSTPLTIALPGMLAKYRRRIPMVFEVRDLWPELPIAVGALRNPALRAVARGLEWAAYHAADHVVALSPGMAEGVIARGIPPERVTVIPNSCDLDLFDLPAARGAALRARVPGLAADAPLIVYAGTFGLINGVGYLVDVAAAMAELNPRARFLLVGTGAERERVIVRAHDRGVLGRNLFVWEPLPKLHMPELLAAADLATSLFLPIPAMRHNSANKFFDALAAGCPVAINYGGWQAELLQASGAGLALPADDPKAAAQLLATYLADGDALRRAGLAARYLARTAFDRDVMAARLLAIFERVAGAPRLVTAPS
jgi:glycosyltransferase involved in cell wall biosynthesis